MNPQPGDEEWVGERVTRWLGRAAALDRQFAQVTDRLFTAAAIRPGEAVLDVGCGSGPTTLAAAAASGAGGQVRGLDVSAEMLTAAAAQPVPLGSAPIRWICTDVVGWQPPQARAEQADVVISRFGVMFFLDPPAATVRLARATRPGGRLAFAVWGRRDESALFEVPYAVAQRVCATRGHVVEPLPVDRGPFSWHDPAAVQRLLAGAGWHDVTVEKQVLALPFGGGVGPGEAAAAALDFGPTRTLLIDADEATTAATRSALEETFADHLDAAGHVELDAAVRIVTARR